MEPYVKESISGTETSFLTQIIEMNLCFDEKENNALPIFSCNGYALWYYRSKVTVDDNMAHLFQIFLYRFTSSKAFKDMLNEMNDLAGQHELIAENLVASVIKEIQCRTKEFKDEKKKQLADGIRHQNNLQNQLANLGIILVSSYFLPLIFLLWF